MDPGEPLWRNRTLNPDARQSGWLSYNFHLFGGHCGIQLTPVFEVKDFQPFHPRVPGNLAWYGMVLAG